MARLKAQTDLRGKAYSESAIFKGGEKLPGLEQEEGSGPGRRGPAGG